MSGCTNKVLRLPKVLVTGASGYIGGRLVPTLAAAGAEVQTLIRDPALWLAAPQTVCDLCTIAPDALAAACRGAASVVHLAGEDEVLAARDPSAALGSTVVATERVAEACAAAGVRRLVYLSTVHVYGARIGEGATLSEEMRAEPRSAYAISRLASEHIVASRATGAYELVILRLTNSVGAPAHPSIDRWSLVANDLARQGAVQGSLRLRSAGVQWRDFVSLRDVCATIAAACGASGDSRLPPGTYNLGSGRPATVLALARLIQEAFAAQTGARPALEVPAAPPTPPRPYRVSVDRLAAHGVEMGLSLREAVDETVRFCLQHREEL
ncbi:MAG TPA: SDR family oxidoreductase [Solirubrobacteraceae bacterium]